MLTQDLELKIKQDIQDGTNDKVNPDEHIAKINELKTILENRTYRVARNQDKEQVKLCNYWKIDVYLVYFSIFSS